MNSRDDVSNGVSTRRPTFGKLIFVCAGAIPLLAAGLSGGAAATPASVRIVQAPAGCFVPDVVVDAKGVLHMVYALNRQAYYVRSTDHGATFSTPVQVNSQGTVEFKMGERAETDSRP